MFIDEFIPTLEGDLGICYTHPENLPGVKKDGSSSHFFHRTVNAYATGQRKRRKIHNENRVMEEDVRWHKTGKTKPVVENGLQKGCKKIMVLYKSSKKGCRADKSNWVMHQYHLGTEEDEEGQYVVSKIFYQQQKVSEKNDEEAGVEDPDVITVRTSPRTPKTNPPNPPRSENSVPHDDIADDTKLLPSSPKDAEAAPKAFQASTPADQLEDDVKYREWLADASLYDSLLCNEILDSYTPSNNPGPSYAGDSSYAPIATALMGDKNITCGISDLENLEFDTPPDFQLADLQFGSQDSVFDWLDRL